MREILFRGKRIDSGKWVQGYYIKATHHWHNHGIHEDWIATDTIQNGGWFNVRGKYAVIPESVSEFTGLTDNNGNKIFEGDIVKADGYIFTVKFGKCGGVENNDNFGYMGFYFEGFDRITKKCMDLGLRKDICYFVNREVIGNIHDNQELLKGDKSDA